MNGIRQLDLRHIAYWVLDTHIALFAQFCQDSATFMAQESLSPIFGRPQACIIPTPPFGVLDHERHMLLDRVWPELTVQLGGTPKL
jgi:hypothetical protein